MRLQPQVGYLALPHARSYSFINGGEKIGLGNPNSIYTLTNKAIHDFTSRSSYKN